MVYRFLYWLVLSRLPAEFTHRLSLRALRILHVIPGISALMRCVLVPRDPALRVRALGLEFAGPVGLAAGFDKDGVAPDALGDLGFSFIEVGTVTARAQPGNSKPRLFRLPADRALINRMGFNNAGAPVVASRLRQRRHRRRSGNHIVVGVNIGKSAAATNDEAIADYVMSARAVADGADYVVVNVSSPNTPGLRDFQAVEQLRPLLDAVRTALDETRPHPRVPLLVKISPDCADAEVESVAALVLELGIDGVIATNTTIARTDLCTPQSQLERIGAGGLSGPPLAERALHVLRLLRASLDDETTVIAVGGISSTIDVTKRLAAGATLVQAYTGLIYGGPLWPSRVHRELVRRHS